MRSRTPAPHRRAKALASVVGAVVLVGLLAACSGGSTSAGAENPATTESARTGRPATAVPDGNTIVADGGDLPDGIYRVEFSDEYLAAHGLDAGMVANNHGVWTFVLKDGHWTFDQVAPDITDHAQGIYQVDGENLYWRLDDLRVLHFRWSTDAQGDLRFTQVTDTGQYADFQFALPWTRVE